MSQENQTANDILIDQFREILFFPIRLRGSVLTPPKHWTRVQDPRHRNLGDSKEAAYAEQVYFHPFFQDLFYRRLGEGPGEIEPIQWFERTDVKFLAWTATSDKAELKEPKDCDLPFRRFSVERLQLCVAGELRTAVLMLEIKCEDKKIRLNDVLDTMDYLRRIYAPYVKDGTPGRAPLNLQWLDEHHNLIALCHDEMPQPINNLQWLIQHNTAPIFPWWSQLLDGWQPHSKQENLTTPGALRYQQVLDERMPQIVYLATSNPRQIPDEQFVRLTFADDRQGENPSYPYSPSFLANWADKYAYDRFWHPELNGDKDPHAWMETRFLNSGFSMTMVGKSNDDFFENIENGALMHFRRHYSQMGLAIHLQKAILLGFSQRLAEAVDLFSGGKKKARDQDKKFEDRIRKIKRDFLTFTHRFWFEDISNQMQPQELYEQWRELTDLDKVYQQVKSELDGIYDYLENESQNKQTEQATQLTKIGTLFALCSLFIGVVALVLSAYGANWLPKSFNDFFGFSQAVSVQATSCTTSKVGLSSKKVSCPLNSSEEKKDANPSEEQFRNAGIRILLASLLIAAIVWLYCKPHQNTDNRKYPD